MFQRKMWRTTILCAFCICLPLYARAQSPATSPAADNSSSSKSVATEAKPGDAGPQSDEVLRLLREQQEELKRMRETINEQARTIDDLRQRVERTETTGAPVILKAADIATSDAVSGDTQDTKNLSQSPQEERLGKVEEQIKKTTETINKQIGSMTFSGELRFRYESFYGQLNALTNGADPTILGNPLSTRQRLRIRARFGVRGTIGKEFDWGMRLSTGSFAEALSTNQTLTDFFNHKPFGLEWAYIGWQPRRVPGLRIQAGKFDVPWLRTELTIDSEWMPEGFSETYSRNFKDRALKNITFVAWQLPILERNSAFVRNANGTVNVSESRRGGRDLALYGAQLRGRFEPSTKVGLTLAATDLYFSGTQFITPAQFLNGQLQIPVTVTIPATATTPAQNVTGFATLSRDLFVSGNGNLGVSTATNNAVNRDGRLSSGFNLVDLLSRLDLNYSKRWPVSFILDFVHNTQAHDVVVAGPGGADRFLHNDENNGYWAEVQVGSNKEHGDILLGYTFIRIEKDAVLTPFNYSDLIQQSDARAHRFQFSYTVDPHVFLSLTAIFNARANGLLGVFGQTPVGSLNHPTTRLQMDTTFRF
jgi:uncharacterized FlaG/YvyC family protein